MDKLQELGRSRGWLPRPMEKDEYLDLFGHPDKGYGILVFNNEVGKTSKLRMEFLEYGQLNGFIMLMWKN